MAARRKRRLAAILSADAVGYSRLMAADESGALAQRDALTEALAACIRQHGGRLVDAVGDNLLGEFPSIVDAVEAALAAQRLLGERTLGFAEERRMRFRIGIHLGDVLVDGARIAGDGVNVAARLEALAEPGGVVVSGAAFEQLEGKVDLEFEPLGEHELKNIPRRVRVYRVRASERTGDGQSSGPGWAGVPGFGGRPAIALRPFESLGDESAAGAFADGITDDLAQRLSAFRVLPVISLGSSFAYRGHAVDARQMARELGARFIVEGSVRRDSERVRITAALVDGASGHRIWSERYDRDLGDLFALQDEIALAVAAAIEPEIRRFEVQRVRAAHPRNLDAWELTMRSLLPAQRGEVEDLREAEDALRRALEIDPEFCRAHAALAMTLASHYMADLAAADASLLDEALGHARRALEIDERDALAHRSLGYVHGMRGDLDREYEAHARAVELDPAMALGYQGLAVALPRRGRAEDALAAIEKATRLSPNDPSLGAFEQVECYARFFLGDHSGCVRVGERAVPQRGNQPPLRCTLAAAYAYLGRESEARAHLAAARELIPALDLEFVRSYLALMSIGGEYAERLVEGLRKAGVPG